MLMPLTWKNFISSAKMRALKPEMDAINEKNKDGDALKKQQAVMDLYRKAGVNPASGCVPMLVQMPVLFAMFKFFPSSIELRQESFLWATDLSSYDVAFRLPFALPGFGTHISAFTLIWVVTTLWYTWYSMKQMDSSTMQTDQMKMMKWMQYLMPVMFMFFFNSFASGLTLYLCFSNILNIGQTVVTKKFLIDNEKIKAALEVNKNKPKKEGGWRERLEQAMKEQERVKAQQQKKK